jgi:hypothetical protein
MSSYYLKNGKKLDFRFFEIRNWDDSQEYYANEYFKFKVNENDLLSLGFIYWAHIAIWKYGFSNEDINKSYPLNSFLTDINSKFDAHNIEANPPNFGYDNPKVSVDVFCWDFPNFRVLNVSQEGILASDDEFQEFYFDFSSSDICSIHDLQFEDKELKLGTIFTCNPGDPVFMSDDDFNLIRQDFISKIKTLNNIYSAINFPYLIEIDS